MKSIKNLLIAVLVFSLATPAFADDFINSVLGAAIGGVAGSKVGGGNGRKAAIAAGALGGAFIGGNADQGTERRHRETLRAMDNQNNYVDPYAPSSQRPGTMRQPVRQVIEYVEPVQRRQVVVQQRPVNDCDQEYYDGEYNPEMAQAYCRGQQQRARQEYARRKQERDQAIQAAYQSGLQGQ